VAGVKCVRLFGLYGVDDFLKLFHHAIERFDSFGTDSPSASIESIGDDIVAACIWHLLRLFSIEQNDVVQNPFRFASVIIPTSLWKVKPGSSCVLMKFPSIRAIVGLLSHPENPAAMTSSRNLSSSLVGSKSASDRHDRPGS
jgi:hypothetical protein